MTVRNLLVPTIFFTVSAVFAGLFFNLNRGERKINFWIFVAYTVITLLCFSAIAFTSLISVGGMFNNYVLDQFLFLALGTVHLWAFSKLNPAGDEEPFWHELIYALYVCLIGLVAFLFVAGYVYDGNKVYQLLFATSAIAFILPFFVWKTASFAVAIPAPEYLRWYPQDREEYIMPDVPDDKLMVTAIEVLRHSNSLLPPDRIKGTAPILLELGYVFGILLTESNSSASTANVIEYINAYNEQPWGWNFYVKPKWWQSPRYLDPSITILENGITENDVIVAERV